jgi:FMN phosphatase YigB (HAD superfamily)
MNRCINAVIFDFDDTLIDWSGGLLDFFDARLTSSDVGYIKPHAVITDVDFSCVRK